MPDSAVKSQQLDASELRAVESLDARRSVRFVGRRSWYRRVQGGPPTPFIGVITPVTHLFSAISRGYNSIYN